MAMAMSEDMGIATQSAGNKQTLLSERLDSVFKEVSRLEKLIGFSGNISSEKVQETPAVSKFDGIANALDEIQTRLAKCNIEVEKLQYFAFSLRAKERILNNYQRGEYMNTKDTQLKKKEYKKEVDEKSK